MATVDSAPSFSRMSSDAESHVNRVRSGLGSSLQSRDAPAGPDARLLVLVVALLVYLVVFLAMCSSRRWYEQPFSQFSDLSVHVPRAMKLSDPALFRRDFVHGTFSWTTSSRLDMVVFPWLLSKLMPLLGGIRPVLFLLAVPMGACFVIGNVVLAYRLTQDADIGFFAGFLASFGYSALGGVSLGFMPDEVLPRNFVVALFPWIVWVFLRRPHGKHIYGLYVLLGLLTNMHALASLHLLAILTLSLLFRQRLSVASLTRATLAVGLAFLCALPFVVTFVPHVAEVVAVTPAKAAVEACRFASVLRPSWTELLAWQLAISPLLLTALLGAVTLSRCGPSRREALYGFLALWPAVLLLPWVGVMVNAFTYSFRQLELLRITRYYAALCLPLSAVTLKQLFTRPVRQTTRIIVPALATLGILLLTRSQVSHWIVTEAMTSAMGSRGQSNPVQSSPTVPIVWDEFLEFAEWARSSTEKDALFLAPVDWSLLWVYGQRSLIVNWKGAELPGWAERYQDVYQAYASHDAVELSAVAGKYNADYIVTSTSVTLANLVFANEAYNVYAVRDR